MTIVNRLEKHTKGVWTCDYSPESPLLASGSNDNSILLWDTKSYKVTSQLAIHDDAVYDVKFSLSGNFLASCGKGLICIWDMKNLSKPLATVKDQHQDFIYAVNFIENDKYVVTGFIDGYILIVETADVTKYKKHFIPKEVNYNTIEENNLDPGNTVYHISKFKNLKNDNEILTSHSDGSINTWLINAGNMELKNKVAYFNEPVTSVNTSYDDLGMIASCKDHSAMVWRIDQTDKIDYSLVGHSDIVTCADFVSKDVVATSSYDCSLRLWKLNVY